MKAPWKSTPPFPISYPVFLALRVVLIFWNAKHNREGTQHKSQGQIMQIPPQEQSNSEPSLPSWQGFSICPIMSCFLPDPQAKLQANLCGQVRLGNIGPAPRGFALASLGVLVSKEHMVADLVDSPSTTEEPERKFDTPIAIPCRTSAAARAASAAPAQQQLLTAETTARSRLIEKHCGYNFFWLQFRWHHHLQMLQACVELQAKPALYDDETAKYQQRTSCELSRLEKKISLTPDSQRPWSWRSPR